MRRFFRAPKTYALNYGLENKYNLSLKKCVYLNLLKFQWYLRWISRLLLAHGYTFFYRVTVVVHLYAMVFWLVWCRGDKENAIPNILVYLCLFLSIWVG